MKFTIGNSDKIKISVSINIEKYSEDIVIDLKDKINNFIEELEAI